MMRSLITPQTAVRSLIKVRPMAVGLLDKRKVRFWDALDRSVGEVVGRDVLGDFLDEVSYAKVPAADTDWLAMPLYWLADHLTEGHRDFFLQDVSDIGHLLDVHTIADSEESAGLREIHKAFHDFTRELRSHVDEEEGVLFPKVLRYEACLRDGRVHPEFHRGSIQSYMAIRLDQEEKRLNAARDLLADRIRAHARIHAGSIASSGLVAFLDRLGEKLADHQELESRILFPTAREMERTLYNLGINGDPAVVHYRRGPMDSGILRLEDA
jgi:iron-sulfur cluster repair protein YtfE (RIC family)